MLANNVVLEDALKAVVSMDLDSKNAIQTLSVHKDEIRISKSEL